MRVGFTERGDAALDFSWCQKLESGKYDGAVIITKNVSDNFIDKLMDVYTRFPHVILHAGCTGWGGTAIEPGVPNYRRQLQQLSRLIETGFPAAQCVLRIDPIFPTPNGIRRVLDVLNVMQHTPYLECLRIRISVLDEYRHVKERFRKMGYGPIYRSSFYAPNTMMRSLASALDQTGLMFECCAEPWLSAMAECFEQVGCLSIKDLEILGLAEQYAGDFQNPQGRNGCLCLGCKEELLTKRQPCAHGCKYCYWKDAK